MVVGNRPTRAHNTVVVFLDAVTWLAQIVMFVLLGLLAWPERLADTALPAIAVAGVLMFVARPLAVMICLAPFRFPWREKLFISWVGLRGAVGIFLASIPLLVGIPNATVYFDVAFVVVLISLLVQGWSLAPAARWLHVALPRADRQIRRVELDLPGQLEQELVGYGVRPNSPVHAPQHAAVMVEADARRAQRAGARRRPRPTRSRSAITSICWRRRKRPRRSTVSSPTCRRRRRPIRACSETSSCRARRRSASSPRSTACRCPTRKSR